MDPLILTIGNELAALPVLQASANAFLRASGGDDSLSYRIELVLDEVFTNILDQSYLPGQRERVQTTMRVENGFLIITMRFKGIPFDVDNLQQRVHDDPTDMLEHGGRGISLHLVQRLMDRVEYRNLGKEGQEIYLLLKVSSNGDSDPKPDCEKGPDEQGAACSHVILRRMLPAEAPIVSKLAYLAYDYSYVYEYVYDPQMVRKLNEEERLISFVAVNEENNIFGHFAISRDDRSDLVEMCAGVVDPLYRGCGTMNAMAFHGINETRQLGAEGVFVIAVTTHPYSQKAALSYGLKETALFVSCVQALAMPAIREESLARESVFFMTTLFDETPRGPYHAPAQHRGMLERICRNAGINPTFATCRKEIPLPEHGQMDAMKDNFQAGHIHVDSYGRDTADQVRRNLRRWQLDRLETVFLYLPLLHPATALLCTSFEDMGFFFSGLRPGRKGQDWLVLQFLNNQRYDYGQLKAASPFGREMIDYVRERDPVRSIQDSD